MCHENNFVFKFFFPTLFKKKEKGRIYLFLIVLEVSLNSEF